jgi:hypothetical protein
VVDRSAAKRGAPFCSTPKRGSICPVERLGRLNERRVERPLWPLDKALALFANPAHQHEDRDNRKTSRETNPYADAAERGPEG